jgi:hypothetical protein
MLSTNTHTGQAKRDFAGERIAEGSHVLPEAAGCLSSRPASSPTDSPQKR